jgi:multidrug efflux pump subunit AcrB
VEGYAAEFLLGVAASLLASGLIALIPLPPLDGWVVLARRAGRRPSQGFAKAQHWLDDNNLGVVILLIGLIIPIGAGATAVFLFLLDIITYPVLLLWSAV